MESGIDDVWNRGSAEQWIFAYLMTFDGIEAQKPSDSMQ
jgi:hypothetical protein